MSAGRPRLFWAIVLGAIAAGVVVHWPSIGAGYAADDYLQIAILEGWYPVERHALDLYTFVDSSRGDLAPLMERGTMPWWSHPDLRIAALRPLSSALIYLDHSILGLSPAAKHVHSLLWWALAVVAVAGVVRQLVSPAVGAVAAIVFALDPANVFPIAWLANRAALVSASLGLLGAWAHVRWRQGSFRAGRYLAPCCSALALAGGEYALAALCYVIAYEAVAAPGSPRQRALAATPTLALAAGYLAAFFGLGYGSVGSAIYVDPFRAPGAFFENAWVRWSTLLLLEFLGVGASPTSKARFILGLAILAGLGVALHRVARELEPATRRGVWALLLGALLSMVPMLASAPHIRLLVIPGAGGAGLIAVVIVAAMGRFRGARTAPRGWAVVGIGALLGIVHALIAPLQTAAEARGFRDLLEKTRARYLAAALNDDGIERRSVIVINALHLFNLLYPPYVRQAAGSPMPASYRVLATTPGAIELHRPDARTLRLDAVQTGMFRDPSAVLFRTPDRRLEPNDVVRVPGLDITVARTDASGARSVRFRFAVPLEHPSLTFLSITPEGLMTQPLPPPGGSLVIPAPTPEALL